ncbi:MAG: MFS transporter [Acidimicrobiales bacterium]|nr:MFS transporter [Acidimicrobiales bacterium]
MHGGRRHRGLTLSAGPQYRRRFPAWPLVLMALVGLVDQIDVGVLRGVLPFIQEEWGLSDTQVGILPAAFVLVNAIATIPAGWVADHFRRSRVIGFTLLSWSGLILLSAAAWNFPSMLAARSVMGIGQAVDDPASTSLLGDAYPAPMRAKVFSWTQVSFFLGSGIGLAFGGFAAATWSWPWAFILVAPPSALVAIACFRLHEPRRGEAELPPEMTWEEVDAQHIAPRRQESLAEEVGLGEFLRLAAVQLRAEIAMIFGIRTMRYVLIGVSALLFTVSGIGVWLPIYHERYSGFSAEDATAVVGLLLGAGGLIGTFSGGWMSDHFAQRNPGGRIVVVVYSAVLCAVLFMVSFAIPAVPVRLTMQFIGVLAAAGAAPGLRAAMLDVTPPESRGVGASAFALCAAVLGPAAAPFVVGGLSELTGSLVIAFYLVLPPVIGGLLLLLRARRTIADDAAKILTKIAEEQQLLTQEHTRYSEEHPHSQ